MGVSSERRGLAEILTRENSNAVATRTGGITISEHDGSGAGVSGIDNVDTRTAGQALHFALGLTSIICDENGPEGLGIVTPRLATAFRAKVEEESHYNIEESLTGEAIKEEALNEDENAETNKLSLAPPRIGPEVCSVDRDSVSGNLEFRRKCRDTLQLCIESHSNFSSFRASVCVLKGKWQYEVTLETAGIQQLGWATIVCPFTNEEGVGDAKDSYAYDGKRVRKWNVSSSQYGQPWASGDVIGCCIDLDSREISFYRNGIDLGIAFRNVRTAKSSLNSTDNDNMLAYFPALSLSHGERCDLNFGSRPFRYPVDDFKPLTLPPTVNTLRSARFLSGCLGRLACEVDTSQSSKGNFKLQKDDAYVASGLIMESLGPLLSNPYVSDQEIMPVLYNLHRTHGKSESSSFAIDIFIDFFYQCTEEAEFSSWVENIFSFLSHRCQTSFYDVSCFPETASYPHLALASTLIKIPSIATCLMLCDHFDILVEGLLTRKQPNNYDLGKLMPTVWWLGSQDSVCSEERMKSYCISISISLENIQAKQRDICYTLSSYPDIHGQCPLSNCFTNFVRRLLSKNRWAVRNVQPPGLSDNSVLVSTYFVILDMLKPFLLTTTEERRPTAFPSTMFLRNDNEYFDLGRLGGTYNHVRTEFPVENTDNDKNVILTSEMSVDITSNDSTTQSFSRNHSIAVDNPSTANLLLVDLLDMLVLLFHFGVAPNFKLANHQLQAQVHAINELDNTDRRIAQTDVYSSDQLRHLKEARAVFREDVIEAVRNCCWHRLGLFSPLKQDQMVIVCTYLARFLLRISEKHTNLFPYVPEAYIECVVDTFHALRRGDPPIAPSSPLLKVGLDDIVTFIVKHFSDDRIVHPDSRDQLLQSVSILLQSKQYVKAFEENEYARQHMSEALLRNFDSRFWIPISNIILRLCKGKGFGKSGKENVECASQIFQDLMCDTLKNEQAIREPFLNKLFNMLNWTITEFSVALKDIMDNLRRRQFTEIHQQQRKWTIMFELSINLERIIEFLANELPEIFCIGDSINMVRLCELLVFVLSQTCGPNNLLDMAKKSHFQSFDKINKESILEPIVGIIINLNFGFDKAMSNREKGEFVPWLPADTKNGPIESIAQRLAEMDSPEAITNVKKLADIQWTDPSNPDPAYDNLVHLTNFYEKLRQATQQVQKSKEEAGLNNDVDIPDAYLDPILMTIMKDPVVLPDSQQTIDRSTIQRHLLSSNTDPFTRAELTLTMVKPNTTLKFEIENWQAGRKRKAKE